MCYSKLFYVLFFAIKLCIFNCYTWSQGFIHLQVFITQFLVNNNNNNNQCCSHYKKRGIYKNTFSFKTFIMYLCKGTILLNAATVSINLSTYIQCLLKNIQDKITLATLIGVMNFVGFFFGDIKDIKEWFISYSLLVWRFRKQVTQLKMLSKLGLYGYMNFMRKSTFSLLINHHCRGDLWLLNDDLNVMI